MTTIYDLIILDESGSMSQITHQTISGCNETIQTIKAAQQQNSEVQKHLISIYAFQSGNVPSRYLVKNVPAEAACEISGNDYRPYGGTPLLDAVGGCLADLKATIGNNRDAIGSVTIITDGMENASRRYTFKQVAGTIDVLKELGWEFHFIGANIDVKGTSRAFHIDNSMEFCTTKEGAEAMWKKEREAKMRHSKMMAKIDCCYSISPEERLKLRKEAAKKIFDTDEEER
ncbi:MAG: VWA domain-containing protein [Bacteroidales bacterium]|nr:VWA domain-containing protein [Bacteroidales bacterium]